METKTIDLTHSAATFAIIALLLFGCAARPAAAADLLQACTPGNIIVDGGLEATDPDTAENPNWQGTSTAFGTPLCSDQLCGQLPSAMPRTGTFWAWFGGVNDLDTVEDATLSQTVTFPAGATSVTLRFYLRIGRVAPPLTDTLVVQVDGATQTTFSEVTGPEGAYAQRTVNLTSFANGAPHTIKFFYHHPANGGEADFNVDDITLDVVCGAATAKDSIGLYVASTRVYNLRNTNTPGPADIAFGYGGTGDVPLKGDWDGDGDDTPGVYRPSAASFFLRNSNSPGQGEIGAQFGGINSNFVPLSGDWNGDGVDTIGLYDRSNGTFFLKNTNTGGAADVVFFFGGGGANVIPITGDWDGNGTDTIGLYVTTTGAFFLKNTNSNGAANIVFTFGGGGGYLPVVGDWDNNGTDTVAIYHTATGTFFIKNSNSSGPADLAFTFGGGNQIPLAGDWDNLP